MTATPDFDQISWAPWMEDTVKHMIEDKVEAAILVAFCPNGKVALTYTDNTIVQDLAMAAFWCQDEAMTIVHEHEDEEESEEEQ